MGEDVKELGKIIMEFNFEIARWNTCNYKKEFNVNGKGINRLTSRQFDILLVLYKQGYSTVSQFENMINISKSSISLTLAKLVKEGYLRREQPEGMGDGRKVYFYITEKGMQVVEEVRERVIEMFCDFYESLNQVQKKDLKIGIEKLKSVF